MVTFGGAYAVLAYVAQRAVAYGIGSITIDGADVWAVYRSVRAAVRRGLWPRLRLVRRG